MTEAPLSIHTLEARGNVALEVAQAAFDLTPEQMRREIAKIVEEVIRILRSKGVAYVDLRNALTPQPDRQDIALLFDTARETESFYGAAVARAYIPLLPKDGSISVLEGDLLGNHGPDSWLRTLVDTAIAPSGNAYEWRTSTQFFCVFIHNLSDAQRVTLTRGLQNYRPFIGHLDTTYGSRIRNYLSTILVPRYIKHRDFVILGHEDEFADTPDVNILDYPFEDAGLDVRSLRPTYYGVCLAYKIERTGVAADPGDIRMSLNAISATLEDLQAMEIEIADPKFEYLRTAKPHVIAGIGAASKHDVIESIRDKLEEGYIYNLSYLPAHSVSKFNMLLELEGPGNGDPLRLVVAFEYLPATRQLRLITAY